MAENDTKRYSVPGAWIKELADQARVIDNSQELLPYDDILRIFKSYSPTDIKEWNIEIDNDATYLISAKDLYQLYEAVNQNFNSKEGSTFNDLIDIVDNISLNEPITVEPNSSEQVITPQNGAFGLSKVVVEPVLLEEQTRTFNSNGTFDIEASDDCHGLSKATVIVAVDGDSVTALTPLSNWTVGVNDPEEQYAINQKNQLKPLVEALTDKKIIDNTDDKYYDLHFADLISSIDNLNLVEAEKPVSFNDLIVTDGTAQLVYDVADEQDAYAYSKLTITLTDIKAPSDSGGDEPSGTTNVPSAEGVGF